MAHGVHPNFMDMHEEYHRPEMQKGLVIKHNANQRYATSGVTSFLFQEIGKIHNLPTQVTSTYRWSSLSVERGKMIKRRFNKMEHGDRDDASNQFSSSSSESEIQVQSEAEEVSSGYKTEDSSANETLVYTSASGFPIDDGNERDSPKHDLVFGNSGSEFQEQSSNTYADKESPSVDLPEYVVKRKSTFKCRICPRIVCLNEEALSAHLKSKRHARSEKLLNEGRLKTVLNIDGKLDEEDTHALYARILASPQALPRKRSKQEDKRRPRKKRMR